MVDNIQAKIAPDIKKLFDELGEPETFDYIEKTANHIPFIAITRDNVADLELAWHFQAIEDDVWNAACPRRPLPRQNSASAQHLHEQFSRSPASYRAC